VKYLICSKDKQKNLLEKLIFLFGICLSIGFSSNLYGQTKPLDNGDLEVLDKKGLQNETYFSSVKKGPLYTNQFSTLFRYGMFRNVELQVNWAGLNNDTFFGKEFSQSTSLGIKAFLVNDSKYWPGISLIGKINLTAYPEKNPFLPSLNILFRKGLMNNFTLTGNYQFILDEQSGDLTNDFAANLDVEITNWFTSYIGVKGVKSYGLKNENALYQEYIELGMLFWIADGFRLYPYYDFGLGGDTNDKLNIGVLYHFK
jgi:hypothetical protein